MLNNNIKNNENKIINKSSKASSELGGFFPASEALIKELGPITALVYGAIWRYSQMESGTCTASQNKLAGDLGISVSTFKSHAKKLIKSGYIEAYVSQGHGVRYKITFKLWRTIHEISKLEKAEGQNDLMQEDNMAPWNRTQAESDGEVAKIWLGGSQNLAINRDVNKDINREIELINTSEKNNFSANLQENSTCNENSITNNVRSSIDYYDNWIRHRISKGIK